MVSDYTKLHEFAPGSKLGIDATKELKGEGFEFYFASVTGNDQMISAGSVAMCPTSN